MTTQTHLDSAKKAISPIAGILEKYSQPSNGDRAMLEAFMTYFNENNHYQHHIYEADINDFLDFREKLNNVSL